MATRAELEEALRAADAAGNKEDAAALASALSAMPSEQDYTNKVKSDFEAQPWYSKAYQAADDMARIASNTLTLGARDKFANFLGGADPATERQKTADARIRSGSAQYIGDLAGAAAAAPALPEVGGAMAAQFANPIMKYIASMAGNSLLGAGLGGVQALNEDQPVVPGQLRGAAWGAGAKVGGDLLSAALDKGVNAFTKSPRMSVPDLRAAKDAAYSEVRQHGVEYTPGTIRGLLADVDAAAQPYPGRHDQVIAAKNQINRNIGQGTVPRPIPLEEVDLNRQILNRDLTKLPDSAQADMGRDMIRAIDDNLDVVGPLGVTARSGDPADGLDAMNRARNLNSRMRKLEQLDDTVAKAERRASRNMNAGEDTTLRSNIDSILGSDKRRRGFTPDEIDAMDTVVRGTPGQNTARQVGRFAPGGGLSWQGMSAGGAAGFALGGPPGAAIGAVIPPAVGFLSKKISERSTKRSVQDLLDLVSSGGNKAAIAPKQALSPDERDTLRKIIMMQGISR